MSDIPTNAVYDSQYLYWQLVHKHNIAQTHGMRLFWSTLKENVDHLS